MLNGNTLQGITLTTSVGRPNSYCWGGGRLGREEEDGRHLSRGRQLPPGRRTFTHIVLFILSCSTSHQPSLRFWYHLNLNLVCEESFGLTWLSCPGGAGDPIWAHLGGQLPRHQGKVPSQHLPRHQGHSSSHWFHHQGLLDLTCKALANKINGGSLLLNCWKQANLLIKF